MKRALQQSRELASRTHIRHALAVERARAMVAMIGRLADQVWAKVSKQIDDGTGDQAKAIAAFNDELPKVMERAFRDHAKWAWARTVEVWSVLDQWQRDRLAARLMREDDISKSNPGRFDFAGEKVKVFKAPSEDKISEWVSNPGWFEGKHLSWQDRLETLSHKIADKDELRGTISKLYADGASPDAIRKAIQPSVEGIKSSAQRIARTESLRIAEEAQRESYRQVDDLIAGMQIWATLDDRTRPEHAARNGTMYPKDACPLVPDAPNCRCFTSPVLRDETDIIKADVGGRPAGDLTVVNGTVQDLETWSAWFDDQAESRQRAILGPDRWDAITSKVKGDVKWAHVVDDSGYMSTPEQIRAADPEALRARGLASKPAGLKTAIADDAAPIVEPSIPETSQLGRLLSRTGAADEPIGVPLDALNRNAAKLTMPTMSNAPAPAQAVAKPNLRGIAKAKLPPWIRQAFIAVDDTRQGRAVANALAKFTPKTMQTPKGLQRMAKIVDAPGSKATDAQRSYWKRRAESVVKERA